MERKWILKKKTKTRPKTTKPNTKWKRSEKTKAFEAEKSKVNPEEVKVNPGNVKVNPGNEDPHVDPPEVPMADNRTMAELLQAPIEGYEDAIVIPKIAANNFELSENDYRDNIQEYVSQAAAANYNQGNTSFRPQMVANQIRPPGFPPHQNHQNNFNRENNFNQNRGGNFNQSNFNQGGNFNQGQLHRPQVNQPPAYQAPTYQAPIPQTQSVTQTDFVSYIKANDAVLRNMQCQGQNVQNQCQGLQTQMANLMDMLSKFVGSNTASSSGSGTLPSNTIINPKCRICSFHNHTRSGIEIDTENPRKEIEDFGCIEMKNKE
nr:hypothetical protein [Tanacetum cinerariifolium]